MNFAQLFEALDLSNKTTGKLKALGQFFAHATEEEKIWALALFTHRRPKKLVTTTFLKSWLSEAAQLQPWLFDACYQTVGDLAETISLLWPQNPAAEKPDFVLNNIFLALEERASANETEKKQLIRFYLNGFNQQEKLVFIKLLTGGLRIGVSQSLVVQALAKYFNLESNVVAHRITGNWKPQSTTFQQLLLGENPSDGLSKPYPFFLAHPLENLENLGDPADWLAEWKWDGIRSQVLKREGEFYVWTRGEELITEKFPDLLNLATILPNGTVIDGELLPWKDGLPLTFALLQTRISRKNVTKKQLSEAPAAIMAYDLLEFEGQDLRNEPLATRRQKLLELVNKLAEPNLLISPECEFKNWEDLNEFREQSREKGAEGLMLKRFSSTYQVGRKRGDWWKWKVQPLTIDAVLMYAQKGHGRRADLFTDYTFGLWHESKLVTFAKAYSGLTDAEIKQVDAFIKKNTLEKFGPVRTVKPELVFELAFEGIQLSTRHKSGLAVRFPRIARWRLDKNAKEANSISELRDLLEIGLNKTCK